MPSFFNKYDQEYAKYDEYLTNCYDEDHDEQTNNQLYNWCIDGNILFDFNYDSYVKHNETVEFIEKQ